MKHLTEKDKLIIATLANYLNYKDLTKFQLSKFEEFGQEEQISDTHNYWKKFLDGFTEIQKEIVVYYEEIRSSFDEKTSDIMRQSIESYNEKNDK